MLSFHVNIRQCKQAVLKKKKKRKFLLWKNNLPLTFRIPRFCSFTNKNAQNVLSLKGHQLLSRFSDIILLSVAFFDNLTTVVFGSWCVHCVDFDVEQINQSRCLLIWAAANNEALSRPVFASSIKLMKCKVNTEERQRLRKKLLKKSLSRGIEESNT